MPIIRNGVDVTRYPQLFQPDTIFSLKGKHSKLGCGLCAVGRDDVCRTALICYQCQLEFHVHQFQLLRVPLGSNFGAVCPDCDSVNVYLRVAPDSGWLVNPTDWQESEEAWWGAA